MVKNKIFLYTTFEETKKKIIEIAEKNYLSIEETETISLNEEFIWIVDKELWELYQKENNIEQKPWNFILLCANKEEENLFHNICHYENWIFLSNNIKYSFFLKFKKILILDDDVHELRLIKKVLGNIGLKVFCVLKQENLNTALSAFKPHLIMLDLYIADTKADTICRNLKTNVFFSEIPIIFLSATENKNDVIAVLESGANDFIKKPFFFEELIARVAVQMRITYMYEEIRSFLANQENLAKKLLDSLEEIKKQKEQIEQMNKLLKIKSITDPLTEIYNRGYLFNVLKRETERIKRYPDEQLSMIMFDIDFFKKINDTYGHLVGDEVIKGVVNTIRKRIRTSDMIARYGGEEFVVLLTNTTAQNAFKVAEEIRKSVENMVFKLKDDAKLKVTISGGVTAYQKGEALDDFFIRLDEALYEAKRTGRNKNILK